MTRGVTWFAHPLALFALICAAPFALQEVKAGSFTPLGDLPGGVFSSVPVAVSADGSVVVGNSDSASGTQAFRWKGGVMTALGALPGGSTSYATAVSADGLVVVGYSDVGFERQGFRWKDGVMTGLGVLPDGYTCYATAVSADGSVVVGYCDIYSGSLNFFGTREAFRWKDGVMTGLLCLDYDLGVFSPGGVVEGYGYSYATSVSADGSVVVGTSYDQSAQDRGFRWKDGVMTGLGRLPDGGTSINATAISADGSVVVGQCITGLSPTIAALQAFRWKDGVRTPLGALPGGDSSYATGVSADGSAVVGQSNSASGPQAFRWKDGVMTGLGDLPGGAFYSEALAVSADGSVVVGTSQSASGAEACVWDAAHGMRSIKDILTAQGLDLTGWSLSGIGGISADGTVVVGPGTNPNGDPEAWRADLTVSQAPKSNGATVLNDFGYVIKAGQWSGNIDLTSTKSHEVITSSGSAQLDCSFDIPKGLEPDKAIKIEGFTCNIIDKNGNVVATTTDSRSVSTPGGKVTLTCFIRREK